MLPTIGPTELIIILVIVILVFGAGKMADVGQALGRSLRDFRAAVRESDESRPG